MSAEGIAFVHDYRPDRADFVGYSAVTKSFVDPIKPHLERMGVEWRESRSPLDGWLNVRFYTWPNPQQHAFISHGIADKGYRSPAKLFGFSWIHTSGPWWTNYYKQRGPEGIGRKLFETGYTKLDPFFNDIPTSQRAAGEKIRVLWAPTHSGINGHSRGYPSTFIELKDDIGRLLPPSTFDVTIAPHPRLREQQGLPVKVTLEEFAHTDVVVADAGSTLYEAWACGLPVVLPTWIVERKVRERSGSKGTLERLVYRERIGHHAEGAGALARAVEIAARDGIGEREASLIEDVFPAAYRGRSGELTAVALAEIAAGPVPALEQSNFMWIKSPDGERYEHVTNKAFRAIWENKGYAIVPDASSVRPR